MTRFFVLVFVFFCNLRHKQTNKLQLADSQQQTHGLNKMLDIWHNHRRWGRLSDSSYEETLHAHSCWRSQTNLRRKLTSFGYLPVSGSQAVMHGMHSSSLQHSSVLRNIKKHATDLHALAHFRKRSNHTSHRYDTEFFIHTHKAVKRDQNAHKLWITERQKSSMWTALFVLTLLTPAGCGTKLWKEIKNAHKLWRMVRQKPCTWAILFVFNPFTTTIRVWHHSDSEKGHTEI